MKTIMNLTINLLVAIFVTSAAIAQEPDLNPKAGDAISSEIRKLPEIQKGLAAPEATKPSPDTPDLSTQPTGKSAVTLPSKDTGQRVPLQGSIPLSDIPGRVKPTSPLPQAKVPVPPGMLTKQLRIDGLAELVDLRGRDPAEARLNWRLDDSDLAVILVRRNAASHCPAAGTSLDQVDRQLRSDPSIVVWYGWDNATGSMREEFSGLRYQDLTDVYVQVCGIHGNSLNGVASNVVHVQIGSLHHTVRIPVDHWSTEWSIDTSANAACFFDSLDTSAILPPEGAQVGFKYRITRGADPVPCERVNLYRYQPSASFNLAGLPRDARIIGAVLKYSEADSEFVDATSSASCPDGSRVAVRSVGLSTTAVNAGDHKVARVSDRVDDPRNATRSGFGWELDVIDWVRSWQRGRSADVTFLGKLASHSEGSACLSGLSAFIDVEYE